MEVGVLPHLSLQKRGLWLFGQGKLSWVAGSWRGTSG